MNFTPKTEKQIAEENLLPVGVYSFEVFEAAEKQSKAGNDMIELRLRVFDVDGNPRGTITDFLMEKIAYKLRHAAVVCGLEEQYQSGTLHATDFINRSGDVKLRIDKDKEGKYPDKNVVADYVVKKGSGEDGPPAGHPAHDPDMPF